MRCDAVDVDTRHARNQLGILHHVERGEPFTADENLRIDISLRGEVFVTLRTGNTGIRLSCRTPSMQTHQRMYTCQEAVLITMDQLLLPPKRARVNSMLVQDMCPATNGATTCHFSGGMLWAQAPLGRGKQLRRPSCS